VAGEPGDGEDGAGPARVGPAAARQRGPGPGPSGTGNRADGAQGGPARAGDCVSFLFHILPHASEISMLIPFVFFACAESVRCWAVENIEILYYEDGMMYTCTSALMMLCTLQVTL
jgi:hypothetical protein